MGISDRGTKAKIITSCDNAFVTNILLPRDPGASIASEAAHRTPPGKRPAGTEINPSFGRRILLLFSTKNLAITSADS
ncbi:hypothetical protein ACQKNB_15170 [Lysinibacillus xylanilyticus]|uniref:hypothetical protein n=1 Tax=Lysinibacillus xylanilyticus TaxID=582475 RepID=UPI003D042876